MGLFAYFLLDKVQSTTYNYPLRDLWRISIQIPGEICETKLNANIFTISEKNTYPVLKPLAKATPQFKFYYISTYFKLKPS